MRNTKMYSTKVNAWEVLVSSLMAKLGQMPFLEVFLAQLTTIIASARSAVLEQEAARAQFHAAIGKRQEIEREGEEIRGRIAAYLKGHYGFRNDELREFGLNPLPRQVRRPATQPPPVEDAAAEE